MKRTILALLLSAALCGAAYAAGTLVQIQANGALVSTANPLPTVGVSGGGTGDVNIASVGGNAVTTTIPVSGTVSAGLNAGANSIGTVGLNAGSQIVGKVGIDQTTPGTTNLVSIGTTGTVGLNAGTAVIGHVINDAGSAVIGHVIADTSAAVIGH